MKKTDLEKLKGLKIRNRMKQDAPGARRASAAGDDAAARLSPLLAGLLGRRKDDPPTS